VVLNRTWYVDASLPLPGKEEQAAAEQLPGCGRGDRAEHRATIADREEDVDGERMGSHLAGC
jgi:hypothetical protein